MNNGERRLVVSPSQAKPVQVPMPSPDDLHPIAQEAAVRFSEALQGEAEAKAHALKLIEEINVLRRHNAFLERQLDAANVQRDVMQRYVTEMRVHLDGIQRTILAAQQASLAAVEKKIPTKDIASKLYAETEHAVAAAAMARTGNAPPQDETINEPLA